MQHNSSSFNEFFQTQLNDSQKKAVSNIQGPLLVVAGAGSGKTRVITTRIANLMINHEVPPQAILALTFTNKAALQMKERIEKFLPGHINQLPFIGTFHSYCLRILKKNVALLENPFATIMDEDDQLKIIQGIITRSGLNKKITAKNILYQISQVKNQAINPGAMQELFVFNPFLKEIYYAYEHEKKLSNCLDFDDLLLETVKLFANNPAFKKTHQELVRHILVDEYQDTNLVQHELLKHMTQENKKVLGIDSLCVVGDEDQSIYSWRGATVANIMNFSHDFAKTKTITIEQNYRTVQPILDIANQVISNNDTRNPKQLWSTKSAKDRARGLICLSEYQEAEAIAYFVKSAITKQDPSTIAILYRTHFQSRALEEALIRHSIPYKIVGGVQFYERKEIKDILAYLKLVINPFDRTSFLRIINIPTRGLGAQFEQEWHTYWSTQPFLTFMQVGQWFIGQKSLTKTKHSSLQQFLSIFSGLEASQKPIDVVQKIITAIDYYTYLKDTYDTQDALNRIDNIKELLNAIIHFESQGITTSSQLLDEIALMQEHKTGNQEAQSPILLMTLHAAKGLEFQTVILPGLEEGLLPSSRSLANQDQIQEERRLFYVGITRTQEHLLCTQSRFRYTFGTMTDQQTSRFINEISSSLICFEDASYWQPHQFTAWSNQWLGVNKPVVTQAPPLLKETATPLKEKINAAKLGAWKKNQPVHHEKFGIGTIGEIEIRTDKQTYLTVNFKTGTKKIDARFVKSM
jgi:DNA helicase-2/ATP-dependent DNA helicase PcrA